jgi:16S rRNA C967 or C1407 C5-methylase (RsmB/RsmF family)
MAAAECVQARAACKPGGFILYSTCTLTAEENEENVAW